MKAKNILFSVIILTVFFYANHTYALSDVSTHWADKEIAQVVAKGIMAGFPNGTFKPDQPLTRAQLAKVIAYFESGSKDAALLTEASSPFKDVADTYWAKGSILWCGETGIMKGQSAAIFAPEAPVTRAEAAVVFARMLKLGAESSNLTFKDAALVPAWAKDGLLAASDNKIISGYPDGTFRPSQKVTRGEMAALLTRAADFLGQKYEGYGTLQFVDGVNKIARITVFGQSTDFHYENDLVVYQKHRVKLGQVPLPANVYYILSDDGKLKYLEITNESAANFFFSFLNPFLNNNQQSSLSNGLAALGFNMQFDAETANNAATAIRQFVYADAVSADGSGISVAVLDSGVDVAHPDLRRSTGGKNKISLWKDFTAEGFVSTAGTAESVSGNIYAPDGVYKAETLISKSGSIHFGYLKDSALHIDLNNNGLNDTYSVAVLDSDKAGVYDTIYLDTNQNHSFDDEKPLKLFNDSQTYTAISTIDGKSFTLFVGDISPDGSFVNFGFDALGHGTAVSCVLAGNGSYKGIAPASRLMMLKVVKADGKVDYDNVVRAVKFAAENGAKVINMSFAFNGTDIPVNDELADLIKYYSESKGVIFIAAAGNSGPGVGSINYPANLDDVIAASGVVSPELYDIVMNTDVKNITLMSGTSVGPRPDGLFAPTVAAPALTVTAVPLQMGQYAQSEGTSFASPVVAGAVAQLLQAGNAQGKTFTPQEIKEALFLSGEKYGFGSFEVGGGILNVKKAMQILLAGVHLPKLELYAENTDGKRLPALFVRNVTPDKVAVFVKNPLDHSLRITWRDNEFLQPLAKEMYLPAHSERQAWFEASNSLSAGVWSGYLEATDEENILCGRIPFTLIKPVPQGSFMAQDMLQAGQIKRYFFDIPDATTSMLVKLTNQNASSLSGMANLYLFDPDGKLVKMVNNVSAGQDNSISIDKPQRGRWEIIAEAQAENGANPVNYALSLWANIPVKNFSPYISNPYYIIEASPIKLNNGQSYLTLTFRNKQTLNLLQGNVVINGSMYTLKNGRATFKIDAMQNEIDFELMLP